MRPRIYFCTVFIKAPVLFFSYSIVSILMRKLVFLLTVVAQGVATLVTCTYARILKKSPDVYTNLNRRQVIFYMPNDCLDIQSMFLP